MAERKVQLAGVDAVQLLGFNDANLQLIEDRFGATITVRGDQLTVRGSESDAIKIEKIFKELIYILNKNGNLAPNDVDTVIDLVTVNGSSPETPGEVAAEDTDYAILYTKVGIIKPRTPGQKNYVQLIRRNDIVFGIGPAGTGKTYLAVAMAIAAAQEQGCHKGRPCTTGGRGRGEPRISPGRHAGEGRSVSFALSMMRSTICCPPKR